jgi:hypothetical protein
MYIKLVSTKPITIGASHNLWPLFLCSPSSSPWAALPPFLPRRNSFELPQGYKRDTQLEQMMKAMTGGGSGLAGISE